MSLDQFDFENILDQCFSNHGRTSNHKLALCSLFSRVGSTYNTTRVIIIFIRIRLKLH